MTADLVKAASETAAHAIKVAEAARAKLATAPKAADPEACKQAAEALVGYRWTSSQDTEKVAQALSDPTTAVTTLLQVVKAASAKIEELSARDGRLANGSVVPAEKAAAAAPGWGSPTEAPESPADMEFYNRIMRNRSAV